MATTPKDPTAEEAPIHASEDSPEVVDRTESPFVPPGTSSPAEESAGVKPRTLWNGDDDFVSLERDTEGAVSQAQKGVDKGNHSVASYDSMMEISPSSSDDDKEDNLTTLPPWMANDPGAANNFGRIHPLIHLHNEIVSFCKLMEPTSDELKKRSTLVERLKTLIVDEAFPNENVEPLLFGSQATGLLLPTSDIDLVVLMKEKDGDDGSTGYSAPLHRLEQVLMTEWHSELSSVEVIENTRVPLIKFTHAATQIQVDISFDQANGPEAAKLMKTFLDALPPLRPLTITIKYFLAARALNQPYTGGVGSHMLQLMIVAFLQNRERHAVHFRQASHCNLGSLLLEFFELYGIDFNYLTTGVSVRHDGFFFPKGATNYKANFWNAERPYLCALENPLDPTISVGTGSFRIQMVQRAFAAAYKLLLAHVTEPLLNTHAPSILAAILPTSREMKTRRIS